MKCPSCGGEGISLLRRLFIGPLIPAKCKLCGRKVRVTGKIAYLCMIPLIVTYFFVIFNHSVSIAAKIVLLIVSGVISTVVEVKVNPLIIYEE